MCERNWKSRRNIKNVSCKNCDRNPDGEQTGDEWNRPRTKFSRNLVFVGPIFPRLATRFEIRYAMCRIVEALLLYFIFFPAKKSINKSEYHILSTRLIASKTQLTRSHTLSNACPIFQAAMLLSNRCRSLIDSPEWNEGINQLCVACGRSQVRKCLWSEIPKAEPYKQNNRTPFYLRWGSILIFFFRVIRWQGSSDRYSDALSISVIRNIRTKIQNHFSQPPTKRKFQIARDILTITGSQWGNWI